MTANDWDIGTGVRGYAWEADDPRAVLLLQHGFAEYAERYVRHYSGLVPSLLNIGVSVYAFDLDGHGHSPGPRGMTDVEQGVSHHLVARRLLSTQPLPVFLFGHSLGGIITATSVVRDAGHISGVILSSAPLLVRAGPLTRLYARVVAAAMPTFPATTLDPRGISRIAAELEAAASDSMMYHGKMSARLGASVLFTSRDNWKHYARWRAPTLAIHGSADTFTAVDGSRRFVSAIASPDKTIHIVDGGYHELLNDTGREETRGVVLRWLEERLA